MAGERAGAVEPDGQEASGLYYEDYTAGWSATLGPRVVSRRDVTDFIRLTAMDEPLFTDRDYALRHTGQAATLVPGVLVLALAEGLVIQAGLLRGTGLAYLGGQVRLTGPTHPGDALTVQVSLCSRRRTSRPGRGIVETENIVTNQDGAVVLVHRPSRMVRTREAGDEMGRAAP